MAELTKEFMQDIISGNGFGVAPSAVAEMARQLLAGMEQEPVAWLLSGGGAKNHVSFNGSNAYADPLREVTPLYAAQQVTSVPEQVPESLKDRLLTICDLVEDSDEYCQDIWNACRAAMLQAGNSPVIPGGWVMVPVEPTEDMIIQGFESEPDESFSEEKDWLTYEAMSGCQQAAHRAKLCWAAMIAAAPQQEV